MHLRAGSNGPYGSDVGHGKNKLPARMLIDADRVYAHA